MKTFVGAAWNRVLRFFGEPLTPRVGFLATRTALLGASLASKAPGIAVRVSMPLPSGCLDPSFDRPNIPAPREFEEAARTAARRLGLASSADVLLLPPEACFKAFLLVFEEFPVAAAERKAVLDFRLNKILPARPPDLRMGYAVLRSGEKTKVFLTLSRASIVEEYEGSFEKAGLKVRAVSLPSLGLLSAETNAPGKTLLFVNAEEDSVGLLAVADGDILLYRFKPFFQEGKAAEAKEVRTDLVAAEIHNTLRFLEDREGRKIDRVALRFVPAPPGGDPAARLEDKLAIPVRTIATPFPVSAGEGSAAAYAPLLGHLS